jgi:hypothetical protein
MERGTLTIHSTPSDIEPASALARQPLRLARCLSFPVTMGSLFVLLAVLTVRGRFDDPDMWWHLKSGQIIATSHRILMFDQFSYTSHQQAFVPQEWLAQLSIYAAYRGGGLSGLMFWLVALSSLLLIAGFVLCAIYARNVKVGFLGGLVIWFFATTGFSIRPQLLGYIFLITELLFIHLGRARNPRWFLGLPILFAVWINCHGSFLLGILVMAIVGAGSFVRLAWGPLESFPWDSSSRRAFLISAVLSLPALFLNPDGLKQILYPLNTMFRQPINLANIEEWKPLALTDPRSIGLVALLLCIIILVIGHGSRIQLEELALLALGSWLALSHTRFCFVFGILAAPVLARQLFDLWTAYDPAEDRAWLNAVLTGVALAGVILSFPAAANLKLQVEKESPVKAVNFIRNAHLAGPMLNDYRSGGYLIWAAPEYPVFVDGRADLYEWSGFLGEFGRWATLAADPNSLLQKYSVNFCLLSNDAPMAPVLAGMKNWKLAYSDSNSFVFVRTASRTLKP